MLVLVEGKENTISLEIDNAVKLEGFSATFAANGAVATLTDLTRQRYKIKFLEAQSEKKWNGYFGEIKVYDSKGNTYYIYKPQFKIVPQERDYEAIGNQKIVLTIAFNYANIADGGGGSSGGGEVTKKDLDDTLEAAKKYTDDNIEQIGDVVIDNTKVEVQTQDGETIELTVQEAMQKAQNVSDRMTEIIEHGLTGYTEDKDEDGQPDDGILYLGFQKAST